ncbi:hypothetical protein ACO0K9_27665 [Undibacterium sp. Ji50W]|uniref:hypothetical protein n=1 Tax=Undibacterium sp. Ji50W TaxID=3413041 RepID=UPI003BF401FB
MTFIVQNYYSGVLGEWYCIAEGSLGLQEHVRAFVGLLSGGCRVLSKLLPATYTKNCHRQEAPLHYDDLIIVVPENGQMQ